MKQRLALKLGTRIKAPAPKKPIARQSEKMKDDMKEYLKLREAFLAKPENKMCQIKSPVCTKKATDVNHKRRRGSNLSVVEHWQACCKKCNSYIEQNDAWAREHGHLESVHKIDPEK